MLIEGFNILVNDRLFYNSRLETLGGGSRNFRVNATVLNRIFQLLFEYQHNGARCLLIPL